MNAIIQEFNYKKQTKKEDLNDNYKADKHQQTNYGKFRDKNPIISKIEMKDN